MHALKLAGMGVTTVMLLSYIELRQAYFLYQDKDIQWKGMATKSGEFANKIVFGEIGKGLAASISGKIFIRTISMTGIL